MTPGRILAVADEQRTRERVVSLLSARGHQTSGVGTPAAAVGALATSEFDLVVVNLVRADDSAWLLREVRGIRPDQEIVLVASREMRGPASAAAHAGASDVLPSPVEDATLALVVERSLERVGLRRERTRLLDENLEFVRHEVLYRRSLDLLSTLDLERLQETALAELCAACDAQSGALWVADERGMLVLRAYRGLVDRPRLAVKIDPASGPLAEGIRGRMPFPPPDTSPGEKGREPGFYVPLVASSEVLGLALVADKLRGRFTNEDQRVARSLGDFAATALRNARRYQALERLGLRDRDTTAYNLAYFVDYAGKEIYKARRYTRTFSLLTLVVENLESVRKERGAAAARNVTRAILGGLSRVVRDADVVAKATEGEFYALLPETDHFGAVIFARRAVQVARGEIQARQSEFGVPVKLRAGSATFPTDGEDFDELIHRGRTRLEEARDSLASRLMLEDLDFWGAVNLLLGEPGSPPLPLAQQAGPSRRGRVPPGLFGQIQREAGREVSRNAQARGVIYVGGMSLDFDIPILVGLETAGHEAGTRVCLVGRRSEAAFPPHPSLTAVYFDGDERLLRHEFLVIFTEGASYAFVQRKGDDKEAPWAFHTSDAALVDLLVDRLETTYDLQPF